MPIKEKVKYLLLQLLQAINSQHQLNPAHQAITGKVIEAISDKAAQDLKWTHGFLKYLHENSEILIQEIEEKHADQIQ